MLWFWILATSVCMVVALKGRFSAKPFLTMAASMIGVLIDSFYLGTNWPIWNTIHWQQSWIVVTLFGFQLGFLWMFFRSLMDLYQIHQKLLQIIYDQRLLTEEVRDKFKDLRQQFHLRSSSE